MTQEVKSIVCVRIGIDCKVFHQTNESIVCENKKRIAKSLMKHMTGQVNQARCNQCTLPRKMQTMHQWTAVDDQTVHQCNKHYNVVHC